MKRIYRVQNKKHEYFIPTALRSWNYNWLNENLEITDGIILDDRAIQKDGHSVPEDYICEHSIRAYYLSLLNIIKKVYENPILKKYVIHDTDSFSLFNNINEKAHTPKESKDEFNMRFMDLALHLTHFENYQAPIKKLEFLKLSQKFQHLNFIFNDDLDIKNMYCGMVIDIFPTMCLDFSDDIGVMEKFEFINPESRLFSIDLDKVPNYLYDDYTRKYDYKISYDNTGIGINVNNNELMKYQKGYCIYWPWFYMVDELIKNKMFGFQEESIRSKNTA